MTGTVLVIDDNRKVFESLEPNFRHFGLSPLHAADSSEAFALLKEREIQAILLDIKLGSESGVDVLQEIRKREPAIPVIMITGFGSIDSAVQSMKLGAYDYVKKPLDFEHLYKTVENAIELYQLTVENAQLKQRLHQVEPPLCIRNQVMFDLVENTCKIAQTDIPVLITGENGSGKELIADYIHKHSDRKKEKMHKINCAAFPESLLDNELFGHEKGAYTGATAAFPGIFERAHGSTLFLDEIGDMPLTIQAKILRVLQNKEVRRIGGSETISINVRFVAATNQNLGERIRTGLFREDLYFRLNTAIIQIPPLRERMEDLPHLVDHFLAEFSNTHGKPVTSVSDEVMDRFQNYHWPGNIRELRNTINYAIAITSGSVLSLTDLPPRVLSPNDTNHHVKGRKDESERQLIAKTLAECRWNKKHAAQVLGISRKTLYAKIERYGINT